MTILSITEAVFKYLDLPKNQQAARLISLLASKHKVREKADPATNQEISDLETIEGNFLSI